MSRQENRNEKSNIIIYTTEDGLTKIETTFDEDTVWLSIDQMADLFQRDRSVIGKHVRNIFKEGELVKESGIFVHLKKYFTGLTTFAGKQPTLKEAVLAKNY